ncbi:MAG: hypothetical protein VYC32_01435 [Planctomycetota bacterium]|nr:hypothetical protein [Planctomycetota bacterium]
MFARESRRDRQEHHNLYDPECFAEGFKVDFEEAYSQEGAEGETHKEQIEEQRGHDEEAEQLEDGQREKHCRGGEEEQGRRQPCRGKLDVASLTVFYCFPCTFHIKKNYLKLKIIQGVSYFLGFFISTNPCEINIYDTVSVNFGDAAIRFHAQAVKLGVVFEQGGLRGPLRPFSSDPLGKLLNNHRSEQVSPEAPIGSFGYDENRS